MKRIPGTEGYYATTDGVIICTVGYTRILPVYEQKTGHLSVCVEGKTAGVHRLVARTFPKICGKWFDGCEVDHIDGNPQNNNAFNLRTCTHRQNLLNPITTMRQRAKNTKEGCIVGMYSRQGRLLRTFTSCRDAERETGIKNNSINRCCNGIRKTAGKKDSPRYVFKWITLGSTETENISAD